MGKFFYFRPEPVIHLLKSHMVKNIIAATIVIFLGSSNTLTAQKNTKSNLKFIEDIEVGFAASSEPSQIAKGLSRHPLKPRYRKRWNLLIQALKMLLHFNSNIHFY